MTVKVEVHDNEKVKVENKDLGANLLAHQYQPEMLH